MVMEVVQEDMGDGSMQCTDHPYKSTTTPPGGICAFCLQEKLGKLVSSSFPSSIFPSSSSSPSPNSFRSEIKSNNGSVVISQSFSSSSSSSSTINNNYHSRRSRIPFFVTQKNKKKKDQSISSSGGGGGGGASAHGGEVFRRSKSTTTPRRSVGGGNFVDVSGEYSPRKRGFWSFLSKSSGNRKIEEMRVSASGGFTAAKRSEELKVVVAAVVEENESPEQAAFERKVSRSRSVGCGSRSFSGDFFERISTGFGDCTLRRVESQREANNKPKNTPAHHHHRRAAAGGGGADCIKERVKCGGIFSGFTLTSSSSSSSSSSYLVSSSDTAATVAVATPAAAGHHGRSKSWGWAFASPMRALNKTSSSSGKRESSTSNKNNTPNLTAIPSLLAVRG